MSAPQGRRGAPLHPLPSPALATDSTGPTCTAASAVVPSRRPDARLLSRISASIRAKASCVIRGGDGRREHGREGADGEGVGEGALGRRQTCAKFGPGKTLLRYWKAWAAQTWNSQCPTTAFSVITSTACQIPTTTPACQSCSSQTKPSAAPALRSHELNRLSPPALLLPLDWDWAARERGAGLDEIP